MVELQKATAPLEEETEGKSLAKENNNNTNNNNKSYSKDEDSRTECATDESSHGSDDDCGEEDGRDKVTSVSAVSEKEAVSVAREYVERQDVLVSDSAGCSGIYSGRLLVVPPSPSDNDNDNEHSSQSAAILLPDGHGIMKYKDHPEVESYTGTWKDGAFDGQGMCQLINGDSYSGMHQAGLRHGTGTLQWVDGRSYSGSFYQGLRHGQGCYTWPGGISYSGAYDRGQRTGYGKYVDQEQGIEYTGDWSEGSYHGYGILSTRQEGGPRIYRGHFDHGKAHGQGIEFNPDGSIRHDGLWDQDEIVSDKRPKKKPTANPLRVVQNEEVCDANGQKGIYRGILHLESRLPTGNGVLKYYPTSKNIDECLEEYEGCFDMGQYHGKGRLRWKNKDCYDGDFVNGKKHGKGVYKWHDGRQYKGDFLDDKRHGFGTFIYGQQSSDVYTGEFKDGRREGQGRFVFQDGSVYEGSWKAGRYNGHGKLVNSNARTYIGEFKDGLAHGQGKEIGVDGKIAFEGLWIHGDTEPQAKRKADIAQQRKDAESASQKAPPEPPCEAVVDMQVQDGDGNAGQYTGLVLSSNKRPHGVGRMVYLDGRRIYEGFFVSGSKSGHGRTFFVQQQDFHEGSYKNNVRHGPGTYRWKDGRKFVGNYVDDMRHGQGVFTYPNGDKFDGIFEHGEKLHGHFSFENGVYEGSWLNNRYHGRGKLVVDDQVFDGIFEEGKFVKEVVDDEAEAEDVASVDLDGETAETNSNANDETDASQLPEIQ